MNPPSIEARLLLAAIVQSSDDAIVSKNLDGIITSWNRAAERMFGYPAAEAVGQSIFIVIPHDRLAEEEEVLRRIRRGESVDHFETIRRRKDGTTFPVSLTISAVHDERGIVVGASKIARDISDRRRAEAALAAAEAKQSDLQQRLLALVSASGSLLARPTLDVVVPATVALARQLVPGDAYAVWRHDPAAGAWRIAKSDGLSSEFATREIVPHETAARSVNLDRPLPIENVDAADFSDPDRQSLAKEGIRSMLIVPLTIGGTVAGTLVVYHRADHLFSEVEVEAGRALGNLASAAMTTAELYESQRRHRQDAERANRQAEFLAAASAALGGSLDYERTLAAVADLAVPHVADWCVIDIVEEDRSTKRLAVAHVDPAKVAIARALLERYPENPESPYNFRQVIRTGTPIMLEHISDALLTASARDADHLRLLRELGPSSFMSVPLVAQHSTIGVITFIAAESQRHYTAADLRFAEDVAARAALAVDKSRAYKQANDANRLKDEFLATLSHELRTPLNAILGYARIVRSGALTGDKHARALETIERNATSLTQIVEDVLDVSRIVTGRLRLNVQPVELPALVTDAVQTILPAADAKGVRIEPVLDSSGAYVSGDAERLLQVVWNLLSNAVKFTPRGGRVQVRLERIDSHVEIIVSDTGIGISADFLPHMFAAFRQADSTFTRERGGLGLGLAIAKRLVEMHGGTIEATSEGLGKGSTFRVRLPLLVVQGRQQPDRQRRPFGARDATEPMAELNGVAVLVVDDDPDALSLLRDILERAGARVTTSDSATAALEAIECSTPDALVADIGMPHFDGFALIGRIRQSSRSAIRQLPAAALTAYARSEDRAKALRSGFQIHLAKPIDPNELVAAVFALTRGRGEESTAAAPSH